MEHHKLPLLAYVLIKNTPFIKTPDAHLRCIGVRMFAGRCCETLKKCQQMFTVTSRRPHVTSERMKCHPPEAQEHPFLELLSLC